MIIQNRSSVIALKINNLSVIRYYKKKVIKSTSIIKLLKIKRELPRLFNTCLTFKYSFYVRILGFIIDVKY